MPELCRFFGIIIRMYSEIDGPHQAELLEDWQRLQNGRKPFAIKPLS